jgi:hypothetical protein
MNGLGHTCSYLTKLDFTMSREENRALCVPDQYLWNSSLLRVGFFLSRTTTRTRSVRYDMMESLKIGKGSSLLDSRRNRAHLYYDLTVFPTYDDRVGDRSRTERRKWLIADSWRRK